MSFNKNLYKKIIAAATALTMTFAATSCGESTSWVAKSSAVTVNSGIYLFYQTEAYSEAVSILTKENEELDTSDTKLLKTMTVEGTDISEWINDKAQKQVKIFTAVNEKFDELGLSLDAEEQDNVNYTVEMYWEYYSDQYEVNGIGKDSFKQLVEFDYKKEQVFLYYYGEGGEKECSDTEIASYLEGNYSRVKTIQFEYVDAEGNALDEDGIKDVKKMAEDYQKRANKGESFDKLIDEYNDYLEKKAEEAAAAAAEAEDSEETEDDEEAAVTTAAAEEEEAETTTTVAEDSEETEEAAGSDEEETDAEEVSEDDEEASEDEEENDTEDADTSDEEAAVTTAAEDGEEAEESETEETEEAEEAAEENEDEEDADPYANEQIYKKGSEDDGYTPSETVNQAIFNDCLVDGDATLVEDEENNCIYLVQRLNIVDREDFFDGDSKTNILEEMFNDEFDNMAAEMADSYGFSFNAAAVKRYDPFNIKF